MRVKRILLYIIIIFIVPSLILIIILVNPFTDSSEYEEIDLTDTIRENEYKFTGLDNSESYIVFGFDLRNSIIEDTKQYVPFLKYLEKTTGYYFQIRFTKEDANIANDIGTGVIQIAAIGADTYIAAKKKYDIIPIARGLNKYDIAEYQSVLFTVPGSKITNVEDLRSSRFAFGSLTSTQGHLIPRIILFKHGILLDDLESYSWTGSHYNCAAAVQEGRFDAGGRQDTLGKELEKSGFIASFHTSEYYPSSGIAVNKDMPAEIIAKITDALLEFDPLNKHAEGLYNWDKTEMPNGFIRAYDSDYEELRRWSIKLNLIGN